MFLESDTINDSKESDDDVESKVNTIPENQHKTSVTDSCLSTTSNERYRLVDFAAGHVSLVQEGKTVAIIKMWISNSQFHILWL